MILRSVTGVLLGLFVGLAVAGCTTEPRPESTETAPTPTDGQTSSGSGVDLVGHAPPVSQGARSVIILEPHETLDVLLPTNPVEMDKFGRDFIPRLIVVREGQAVLFKNSEDELHTVHVQNDDGESLFNVAMPIQGGRYDHTFGEAGDYAVSCNAHQEMHATILVFKSPYAVVAERDGAFALSNVLPGTYDLILRRGPQRHQEVVEIVAGSNEVTLDFPSLE